MSSRAQAARGYRMRPAPRSRARQPSRIHWDKVGRVALVLVLAAVLASYISPTLNFIDAWQDSRTEHASLDKLRAKNAELRERAAALSTDDAAERAARKSGMVAVGEDPYVMRSFNP